MKRRLLFLSLLPAAILVAQPQSPLGGLPGAPMRLGFGSFGIGMGNAMVATRTATNAGYYNPALVAFQESRRAFASVGFLSLDRNLNFLSFSTPVPPSAGLSIGLINAGVSGIDGRNSDGLKTETYSTSENAFLLSFGARINENLGIGVSTKILYYSLYSEMSSTTASFDFGFVYRLSEELTIGAAFQDIGSKYKWDSSKLYGTLGNTTTDFFPVRKRAGIAYTPAEIPLTAASEFELVAGILMAKAGAELFLTESFALRAGVDQIGVTHELAPRPSGGFSVQASVGSLQSFLSYAVVLEPYAPGALHLLTIGVEFQ